MAKKKGGLVSPAFQALLHNLLSQYVKVSKSTHATEYEKKACQNNWRCKNTIFLNTITKAVQICILIGFPHILRHS